MVLLAALEHRVAAGTFDAELALRILSSPQRRLIGSDGVRRITEAARDADDRGIRARVDQAAASLAAELGDQDLALDRWSAVAGAASDRVTAARAEFGAALAAYHLGRGDEARRWLDGSRSKVVDAPDLDISTDALEARILLWLDRRTDEGRTMAMRAVERGRIAVGAPAVTAPVRAAHIDALVAAWEAAIQAEDVDAIVALAEESLETSRDVGLREVLAARSMVGMAREYAAPQSQAADIYRVVWDEAWRAVLPIEAVDVGYRLAAVLFDMLLLDEASRVAAEAEQLAARTGDQGRVRDRTRLVKYQLAMATSDWRSAMTGLLAAAEAEPDPHYRLVHRSGRFRLARPSRRRRGRGARSRGGGAFAGGCCRLPCLWAGCRGWPLRRCSLASTEQPTPGTPWHGGMRWAGGRGSRPSGFADGSRSS